MKSLIATIFAVALVGATAADADVGVGFMSAMWAPA